jgi:rhodanese-related sulfurtransferase
MTAGSTPLQIEVEDLYEMRQAGSAMAILDVREPWEVEICRIEGSIDIPLGDLQERVGELPTDRPLVVMCHHGGRSAHATAWLRQNGFGNATNLEGGINAWAREIDQTMKVY